MRYIFWIIVVLIWQSCGGKKQENTTGCITSPSAIFSDTMNIVTEHSFEAEGQESTENAVLKNGTRVEILQSGCEKLSQEFRFSIMGNDQPMSDQNYIAASYITLGGLSKSSPMLAGLADYADLIAKNSSTVRLGQAFTPDPSISIQIDKLESKNEKTIIIALSEL